MGEHDRSLRSIREDEDDINLGKEPPEPLHPPKLASACGEKNGDRIRFDGHPESFLQIFQALKAFDRTFRDRLMNSRLESLVGSICPFRIIQKLHGVLSLRVDSLILLKHATRLAKRVDSTQV
jgi:hypothetical protein